MADVAPYGSWPSPITAADVAHGSQRLAWLGWIGDDLCWTQSLPDDGGRVALMRLPAGSDQATEVLAAPWNVRSRVIEYGGHPWTARTLGAAGPVLIFADWSDQRLYRVEPDQPESTPRPISPAPAIPSGMRFAELFVHPDLGEVWCVRETHTGPAPTDVRRDIVAIPLDGSAAADPSRIRVLAASHHFLCCPRLSPDGSLLSWIGWDHPSMPWDETTLCVAPAVDGSIGEVRVVAGGAGIGEAIVQAEWAGPGTLVYVSDPDGWWNLYRLDLNSGAAAVALCPREEEFGGALWQFGSQWITPLADGAIAVIHGGATNRLSVLGTDGALREIRSPCTEWSPSLAAHGMLVAGVAGSAQRPPCVVLADPAVSSVRLVSADAEGAVDQRCLPEPVGRTFLGSDGRDIHANVYQPRNPGFTGPPGQPAPYVVWAHGGPTGHAAMVYDLEIAYFTSRGIGVVEVNYGGSTGHGRAYRERLAGNWGVVDVADCAEVALALAAEGTADASRLAIRGGSAGGWTSACSIISDDRVYRCGVIYYPILDLAGWRTGETHDFESQYLESLVGPWPAAKNVYNDRSPVNNAGRIEVPFLLMQGLEDVICPPLQCDRLLSRIDGRGVPHAYLAFEGEQHGFRRAETIVASLEAELSFLGQVLGFDPPGIPRLPLVR